MKRFLFILLCICVVTIPYTSHSQKREFTGYYIDNNGETIKGGFAKYTQWSRSPANVEFISSSAKVVLTPSTCKKFVVDGYDEYISFTGSRQLNPIDDDEVLKDQGLNIQNDVNETLVGFLRLITRTRSCELYSFTDSKRKNIFYRIPGQEILELKDKKYYDLNRINESYEYRQQLRNLFGDIIDQKKLNARLENLVFDEKEIASFLEKLFSFKGSINKKTEAGLMVFAGISMNTIKIDGADASFNTPATDYGWSYSPALSVGYYFPIARNFERYFLFPRLTITKYKNKGEDYLGTFINTTTYQTDLVTTLEFNGGANIVNHAKQRIFISGGFGWTYQLNGKKIEQLYAASTKAPYGSPLSSNLTPLTFSMNAGTGVVLNKKMVFNLKYLFPSPIMNLIFATYTPKSSGVQFLIGYKLK